MLHNKYKYSVNRGLNIQSQVRKKGTNMKSYVVVSQSSPILYDISVNSESDTIILYNDHEYLHRRCTLVTESTQQLMSKVPEHYKCDKNNLTVFIANEPTKSEEIIMGCDGTNSLLLQSFRNLKNRKQQRSQIQLSIVGVCSQNILTDQFYQYFNDNEHNYNFETIRPILRLKNQVNSLNKYELQDLTKKNIQQQHNLRELLAQYKEIKNQKQYLSMSSEKQWDWLQAELFIMTEVGNQNQFGDKVVLKSHYLLKVNQYLQTTSSLTLKLGITLRKLQQKDRKGSLSNEAKLFKLLSNCWLNSRLQNIHLFLQVGHHLTLKQEYLALVSTSEIVPSIKDSNSNFEQLPFCYIKGYQNYPKITSFLSKLNKQNIQHTKIQKKKQKCLSLNHVEGEVDQYTEIKMKVKPYAKDTFSSIEKKRMNSVQMDFEQAQEQHNKNLDSIIQQAASLYRQSDQDNFRLSYIKKANNAVLKRHKKIVERFSTLDKLPSEFYRSERMRHNQITKQFVSTKTPKETFKSEQRQPISFKISNYESAYEIYAKGKRIRNYRQYSSKKQKRQSNDFVQQMVKKQMSKLQKQEDIFLYDEILKEIY